MGITDFFTELSLNPARVRPVGIILLVLTAVITVWGTGMLLRTLRAQGNLTTVRMSLRMIWVWSIPLALVWMLIGLALVSAKNPRDLISGLSVESALTLTVPLAAGLHAALALSIPEEPLLELHLTFRRPFVWLAAERFLTILAIHCAIGLLGTVIGIASYGGDFSKIIIAWLPPTVLLAGLGFRLTVSTRQVAFGAVAVLAAWIGTRWYSEQLTLLGAFLWPVNPFLPSFSVFYLRPGMLITSDYALNRWLVVLAGLALVVLALQGLRDNERIFTGQRGLTKRNS